MDPGRGEVGLNSQVPRENMKIEEEATMIEEVNSIAEEQRKKITSVDQTEVDTRVTTVNHELIECQTKPVCISKIITIWTQPKNMHSH